MNPKEALYLSIDDQTLKMAKVRETGASRLITGVYFKALTDLTSIGLSREIVAGLRTLGSKVREVTVSIPSKYAITKNIEVPSLDPQEIESIVKLQAVRHTPYSREEVIVGHINLEKLLERYTKSLLIIVSNDIVKTRTDAVELAGLSVVAVKLSSEVIARALTHTGAVKASEGPCVLVSLGEYSTDFLVIYQAKPYFLRNIPVGLKLLREDSPNSEKQLLDEIKKTNDSYQAEEHGAVIKQLLLDVPGEGVDPRALAAALETEFGFSVTLYAMDQSFEMISEAKKSVRLAGNVSFLEVFSCVFSIGPSIVDLIPEEVRVRKAFREKGKEIFTTGIFALVIFGLIICAFLTKIYFRSTYYEQITKNFEVRQKDADQLLGLSDKTRMVKNFSQNRGSALKVLDESQAILPEKMYISEISLMPERKILLKGTSEHMSTVFSFVTLLENSPYFKTVNSDYTRSRKEADKDVSDFGISALLEQEGAHG